MDRPELLKKFTKLLVPGHLAPVALAKGRSVVRLAYRASRTTLGRNGVPAKVVYSGGVPGTTQGPRGAPGWLPGITHICRMQYAALRIRDQVLKPV